MRFIEVKFKGSFIIEPEPIEDERGFFARSFCQHEFAERRLNTKVVQCNISFNRKRGTLRGMHYQALPHEEAKLVRCTAGAIYDVIIDLREGSPTFKEWVGLELTRENRRMLYIPEGFAHGYQVLADNSEIFYQMSEFYNKEASRGIRWNDPAFGVTWPIDNPILSEQDRNIPLMAAR